jgi:hypothetical protein
MVSMRCVITLKSTDGAGTGVSVGGATGVGVGAGGGVLAGTGVSVGVGTGVSVGAGTGVSVGGVVGVGAGVLVAVLVGIGVLVRVLVAVAVEGGRGVLVGVGVIPPMVWQPVTARARKAHQMILSISHFCLRRIGNPPLGCWVANPAGAIGDLLIPRLFRSKSFMLFLHHPLF